MPRLRQLAIALVFAWAPASAAHLLNMSYATIELGQEGAVAVELRLDLLRSAGSREAYFELSRQEPSLTNPSIQSLLAPLVEAVRITAGAEQIPLEASSIEFSEAPRADYLDPFKWPRATIHLRGQLPAVPTGGTLRVTYGDGFRFEEPIANTVIERSSGLNQTRWLVANQRSPAFDASRWAGVTPQPLPPSSVDWGGVLSFVQAGFTHILPLGVDHLLFVAALLLGARSVRGLVVVITAFTVAHSLTLAASVLGWVQAPAAWVEIGIVSSIAWMAWSNFKSKASPHSIVIVLLFGLLHGFGFASALSALDLPADQRLLTLFAFNVGVELGQLTFLALMLIALIGWKVRFRLQRGTAARAPWVPVDQLVRTRGSVLIVVIAIVLLLRLIASMLLS